MDTYVLQIWFYVLTSVLTKPLPEADTVLKRMDNLETVDKWNTWNWWRHQLGSAWIPHGDYEPLRLLCLILLSKYPLSKKKFVKGLKGIMVTFL